ncbi:hypothetical protein CHS0354_038651 [Potamilus streckersoni]|uniref:Uncharacterized protein n=1 Tax=Potamilus streckersoni TaxID=2493646 RepID=A0AAE0T7K4_9BIVA|nr:hypothetical protein CHS0354_038651 [Potamilus streckersoni]
MHAADIHVFEWRKSICSFLFLIWIFRVDLMVGLKWTTIPPPINKCVGQDVTFMWTYEKEASEEIRQLKFIVNDTKQIAYKSVRNGFNVVPEYKGRVEARNETGILLKNISAKDTGTYILYPIIAQEEGPNIQSIWLNVIENTRQQWCTCKRLPLSTEWRKGQSFSIVMEGCHLELNSSFCCPKGPAIEYCESDPQKLCEPIGNRNYITDSTIQSGRTSRQTEIITQIIILNELRNDNKDLGIYIASLSQINTQDPTLVQKGNTEPDRTFEDIAVSTLCLTLFLVFFCIISMSIVFWKLVKPSMARQQEKKKTMGYRQCLATKVPSQDIQLQQCEADNKVEETQPEIRIASPN